MPKGVIGEKYTFTSLFLRDGSPTNVNSPSLEVFTFNANGQKVSLVPAGTTLPSSLPAETGRYAYTLTLPSTLEATQQVYAVLQGVDPVTADTLVQEVSVDLFNSTELAGSGLRVSFTPT